MQKLIIALMSVVFVISASSFTLATDNECPPGQKKKGWKCVDIEQPDAPEIVNNNNAKQETNVTFKGEKTYTHAMAPVVSSEATMNNRQEDRIRTAGRLLTGWYSAKQAMLLARNAEDVELIIDVMDEVDYQTDRIFATDQEEMWEEWKLLGWIYVIGNGRDMTRTSAIGLAIKEAMKMGGTLVVKVNESSTVISDGSSWSISTGGGMSVSPQDSGRLLLSGTGGIGVAGVEGSSYAVPSLIFKVYAQDIIASRVEFSRPMGRE